MKTSTIALAALAATSQAYAAEEAPTLVNRDVPATLVERQIPPPTQKPSELPLPNASTSHGCFKSSGNMTTHNVPNLSSGSCIDFCKGRHFWVMGLQGNQCFCGFAYPPQKDLTEDGKCNYPCPSYPYESCGGLADGSNSGFVSVWNLGINVNVRNFDGSSTTSGSSQSTNANDQDPAQPTVVTQTRVATQGSDSDQNKSGPNTAGIAAGAVAAVVAAAAIIGGLIFYIRRKRNAQLEEEHRRNAAVSAFINGSKPPGSSGSMSMTDARLDPVMANRRMSDGSIADNEDYSRRILRVTNA
ncbi:hypothetical protein CDD80_4809 [Ophiocordyceps camponoti-rufipedis]|uniref:WSC domain-containing protein n=1 Tax=Ophiocordyceps camponoti-rufipedis TaxID=2004952 RepID=A0A2C5YWR2_9HYPO|nr:hypothetical protein CDD80_4809 [Ophiocordyceps camponoti-rufipedis]